MMRCLFMLFAAMLLCPLYAVPAISNPLTAGQAENVVKALDLTRPELRKIADAVRKGDMSAARRETAQYFRAKAVREQKPVKGFNKKQAENVVAGRVRIARVAHEFKDGRIDWKYDATRVPGMAVNNEWVWQLGRMGNWHPLWQAYRVTGNEKYAETWVNHLRSWGTDWPTYPKRWNGPGSGWRTIECGIRLAGPWPEAFTNFAGSKTVTDDDILLYLHLSLGQVRHLLAHPTSGNWLTHEMHGIYVFCADHPEFTESAAARKFAVDKLYTDLAQKQFLPDGAQFELSPGYHGVTLHHSTGILKKAEQRGLMNELPKEYVIMFDRATDYFIRLMTPDRSVPHVNDSWEVGVLRTCKAYGRWFPQNRLIQWAGKGADPKSPDVPAFTSCFFPWAGWVVFRQNWNKDAHYLFFDVGPLGNGHWHQDKLNLVLFAFGEEVICDDGGGQYEQSKYRKYACSSYAHNLVIVDRQGQSRNAKDPASRILTKPVNAKFTTGPEFDYAEGEYAGLFGKTKTVTHRRQVVYLKPDLFLVCDRLLPQDDKAHHYQLRWQVKAQQMTELLPGSGILQSDRKQQGDVVIAPLFTDGAEMSWGTAEDKENMADMRGIYVDKRFLGFRPSVTVTHEKNGTGPQTFLTLLCPVKAGAKPLIVKISRPAKDRAAVTFADGRTLIVTVPADPSAKPEWKWSR